QIAALDRRVFRKTLVEIVGQPWRAHRLAGEGERDSRSILDTTVSRQLERCISRPLSLTPVSEQSFPDGRSCLIERSRFSVACLLGEGLGILRRPSGFLYLASIGKNRGCMLCNPLLDRLIAACKLS